MAVLDMAVRIDWAVNVFTIDTGRLPAATYDLMDEIKDRFGVASRSSTPTPMRSQSWSASTAST